MLEEEQVETPTSPKSEPEEPLEPEEQIPSQIETYEPVKEEPTITSVQPEEPPHGIDIHMVENFNKSEQF